MNIGKRGMAMLELIPIILVMFILLAGALGAWGLIHTAILNSIASRNYAFFLFNNRADLSYFTDFSPNRSFSIKDSYFRSDLDRGSGDYIKGKRFHFIVSEDVPASTVTYPPATKRFPTFGQAFLNCGDIAEDQKMSKYDHNNKPDWWRGIDNRRNKEKAACPAWVMVGYGICLDADCGDR